MNATALFSSVSSEWATPQWLFDALNERFFFTLDPCCTADTAKCPKFYTRTDDGLAHSWAGERVFMNPPYGRGDNGIEPWVRKARREAAGGALVVGLLPARVDTEWWQENVQGHADVRFLRGRVHFVPPPGYIPPKNQKKSAGAGFPSAIAVWWGWPVLAGSFAHV
ncbi:DNA N-6-adenine-methyltransferase [Desulfovibrio sp. ZJ369]|uniref:DNA N-6-adenine-methyltransferase n=1 Tax=Desulfovibrio sp. ZJ369 TaxID=2709793 RepID=UPI0013EDAF3E|nr:DNA N-6-adenine-methyltransferase [Desulfovibrio sp. ZJ369]